MAREAPYSRTRRPIVRWKPQDVPFVSANPPPIRAKAIPITISRFASTLIVLAICGMLATSVRPYRRWGQILVGCEVYPAPVSKYTQV